jgi:hypothetical protein
LHEIHGTVRSDTMGAVCNGTAKLHGNCHRTQPYPALLAWMGETTHRSFVNSLKIKRYMFQIGPEFFQANWQHYMTHYYICGQILLPLW